MSESIINVWMSSSFFLFRLDLVTRNDVFDDVGDFDDLDDLDADVAEDALPDLTLWAVAKNTIAVSYCVLNSSAAFNCLKQSLHIWLGNFALVSYWNINKYTMFVINTQNFGFFF